MTESHGNPGVEWIMDGNFIDHEGNVRAGSDYYDNITFDDIEKNAPADADLIDDAISGIKHKSTAERQNIASGDPLAIARRALYLLDKDPSLRSVRTNVESHPSMHNVPSEKKAKVADSIIQAYYEKLHEYKQSVDTHELDHDVLIAIIRNQEKLDDNDLERIAVSLGHDKNYFKPKVRPVATSEDEDRPRDARERQFKD